MSIVMQVIFSMDLLLVFVEKNIRKKDLEKGKKITLNCSQLRGGGCKFIIFWIVQPLFACSASSQQGGNAPCARITLKNLLKLNSSNGLLPTQTDLSHSAEEFEWSHVCLEGVFFFLLFIYWLICLVWSEAYVRFNLTSVVDVFILHPDCVNKCSPNTFLLMAWIANCRDWLRMSVGPAGVLLYVVIF